MTCTASRVKQNGKAVNKAALGQLEAFSRLMGQERCLPRIQLPFNTTGVET
jgi:hypothetical protein